MCKIFDIHTHVYPESISGKAVTALNGFYNFVSEGNGTAKELRLKAGESGVSGFLLFSVATNAHQVTKVNDGIAAEVKKSRDEGFEAYGFAGMHQDFSDFAGELERVKALGLCGVKLHPDIQGVDIDDSRLLKLYELMEGSLPLYLHMGDDRPQYRFSETDKLVRVKKLFPRLEVVAAHLGGYRAWHEADKLAELDGVWFDTSSALWMMNADAGTELIRRLGTERVMFGTDYPVKLYEAELERFFALKLTESERENILMSNAMRFLKKHQ